MKKEDGTEIKIDGSMSYVSQKSWIQNETIKENILFGKPFNYQKYAEVINKSCMTDDLQIM